MKNKKVFCLRIRWDDKSPWGDVDRYDTRKERDSAASMNRIIGGARTHSFEETEPLESSK